MFSYWMVVQSKPGSVSAHLSTSPHCVFSPAMQHKNTVVDSCLWKALLVWSKVGHWRPPSCVEKKKHTVMHVNACHCIKPESLIELSFKKHYSGCSKKEKQSAIPCTFALTLRPYTLFCALEGMCPESLWPGHGFFLLTHLPWASYATWMDKPHARKLQQKGLMPPICISLNQPTSKNQSMAVILRKKWLGISESAHTNLTSHSLFN